MQLLRTILPGKQRQRGAVFIVMLVFMIMGVAAFLVSSLNSGALQIQRDQRTAHALAQAKEALLGRAVADLTSPGSLPCPDTNDNGSAESTVGQPGGNCPSYIGRLPWKTLGLPDLRDGSGERLWYALSPNFRDYVTTNPVNSNSRGTLQVVDNTGVTPIASEAVAVVFAPGNVIGSQQRDSANQNFAQNYLDVGPNNVNNYTAGGPFVAADKTNTFNDRLLVIKASDIMLLVEARVAKELSSSFDLYRIAHSNTYPNPADFGACTSASCPSASGVCIGKVPATTMALPSWFIPNNWFDVIYYGTGTNSLVAGGAGSGIRAHGSSGRGHSGLGGTSSSGAGSTLCSATPATLTVGANNAITALFLMPGSPLAGQTRTGMSVSPANTLTDYLEDTENTNYNNVYVIPGTTAANSNDSIDTLP